MQIMLKELGLYLQDYKYDSDFRVAPEGDKILHELFTLLKNSELEHLIINSVDMYEFHKNFRQADWCIADTDIEIGSMIWNALNICTKGYIDIIARYVKLYGMPNAC